MDPTKKANIWAYLKEHRNILIFALILAAANQIFSFLDPILFRLIIDNYVLKVNELTRTEFITGVLLLLGGIILVALISRIAKTFQDYYVNVITQRVGTSMYAHAVEHTLSLPFSIFEDRKSGEILQKLQKARTDVQNVITSFINIVFLSIIGILFVVVYSFMVHPWIGIAYFLLIPMIAYLAYQVSKSIKDAQKNIVKESAELAGSTTETLRNVELVKSLGLEDQEVKRLNALNNRILELELKKVRIMRKLSFVQGTAVNAMRSLLLFILLYLILEGSISLGSLMSLFFYSFFIFGMLGQLGQVAGDYQQARASLETMKEIFSLPPKKKQKNPKKAGKLKTIEFKNVDFRYAGQNEGAVHNISFKLNAGETIAFAGSSGSGKSTIVKLLVGLYDPFKGKILINGIDSQKIDYDDLRRRIGFVAQETQLFAGTIRHNLTFASPDASDKDCIAVMKMAEISHIIERTGLGLDTKIGEGGIKLSGGEKQRLAIARALLRNPDLLIFDEATSSLDSNTEQSIIKTIQEISKKRPNLMILVIAHRLSTVTRSKRINVLENGKVAEVGSHPQLLKKQGLYAAFWRQQSHAPKQKD